MLNKKIDLNRKQVEMVSIEDLLPKDHLLRYIDQTIKWDFIYDLVKDCYSEIGRPGIDPVVLIKIAFIQYMFGIRSMRQTIKDIEVNIAYKWFLGFDFFDRVPHFSTFGKNYKRRFEGKDLFEQIFTRIIDEAVNCGFIQAENIFIDATHIKASANKNKYENKEIEKSTKHYHEELIKEINADREEHGKKPFKDKDDDNNRSGGGSSELKSIKESKTDPDSGLLHKSEKEKCFAYSAHTACDENNFVLGFEVTAANIHDSVMFNKVYEKVTSKFENVNTIAIDAGYKTPYICKTVLEDGRIPAVAYKRPSTQEGFFKKYEYVFDEFYDCYICPNNELLKYSTTNREGYREYKSDPQKCISCGYRTQCTNSKNCVKVVTRHVWEKYVEEADHYRHMPEVKQIYQQRKETIERVFADAKEKHGMRYTHLRGLTKLKREITLIFSCMNLKKLAMMKRRKGLIGPNPEFLKMFFNKILRFAMKKAHPRAVYSS
jgi:transposase